MTYPNVYANRTAVVFEKNGELMFIDMSTNVIYGFAKQRKSPLEAVSTVRNMGYGNVLWDNKG